MTTPMITNLNRTDTKTVEGVGNLRIERTNIAFVETCYAKVWRGKAVNPTYNYSFKSEAAREIWIQSIISEEAARAAAKLQYKQTRKDAAKAMRSKMTVGTILHYSWGYDQTNCEFFQIVAVRGATVMVRAIASKEVRQTGMMSAQVKPVKDAFIGEPFRKLINSCGVRMDFGVATPTSEDTAHHESWDH